MISLKSLRVLAAQGSPTIPDLRTAVPVGYRGRPILADGPCADGCRACGDVCPTAAIRTAPLAIDLGRCVFCGACAENCPSGKIVFSPEPKMSAASREALVVRAGAVERTPVEASVELAKAFGRSLKLRQVSSGGCNACELELNAIANVNFDVQRFGIEWVASPRHADALVLTGPLTRSMRHAVRLAWDAMSNPRFVVAVGACAISGGLYDAASGVERGFIDEEIPALYVPGCPPHPLTFVNAILELVGARA